MDSQYDSVSNENTSEEGGFEKFKRKIVNFKNEHPFIFWGVIVALIVVVIGVILLIALSSKPKPEKNGENGKEGFVGKDGNAISDEFAYVNSYILSTLGDEDATKNLL